MECKGTNNARQYRYCTDLLQQNDCRTVPRGWLDIWCGSDWLNYPFHCIRKRITLEGTRTRKGLVYRQMLWTCILSSFLPQRTQFTYISVFLTHKIALNYGHNNFNWCTKYNKKSSLSKLKWTLFYLLIATAALSSVSDTFINLWKRSKVN